MSQKEENSKVAERMLSLYSRLLVGEVITCQQWANQMNISVRSASRDFARLKLWLSDEMMYSGEYKEIVFSKERGGYIMVTAKPYQS